jgi:hypothetical protein
MASFTSPGDGTRPTNARTWRSILEAATATCVRFEVSCQCHSNNANSNGSLQAKFTNSTHLSQFGLSRLQTNEFGPEAGARNPSAQPQKLKRLPLTSDRPLYPQAWLSLQAFQRYPRLADCSWQCLLPPGVTFRGPPGPIGTTPLTFTWVAELSAGQTHTSTRFVVTRVMSGVPSPTILTLA